MESNWQMKSNSDINTDKKLYYANKDLKHQGWIFLFFPRKFSYISMSNVHVIIKNIQVYECDPTYLFIEFWFSRVLLLWERPFRANPPEMWNWSFLSSVCYMNLEHIECQNEKKSKTKVPLRQGTYGLYWAHTWNLTE